MFSPIIPFFGHNFLEIAIAGFAFIILIFSLRRWGELGGPLQSMAVAIVLAAALLFSIAEVSQFMTTDEVSLTSALQMEGRGSDQWKAGALHTSTAITLPVVRLMEVFGAAPNSIDMFVKAIHWLVSIFVCLMLARAVACLAAPSRVGGVLPPLVTLIVLPIGMLAYKTFNYDSLSMLFAGLAVILIAQAVKNPASWAMTPSVAVAALGAQEKLSASPVLMVVIVVASVIIGRRQGSIAGAALSVAKGFGIAVTVSIFSTILFVLFGGSNVLEAALHAPVDLLINWTWTVLIFFGGMTPGDVFNFNKTVLLLLAYFSAVIAAVGLIIILSALDNRPEWRARISSAIAIGGRAAPVLVILVGLIGFASVSVYWAPWVPIPNSGPEVVLINGTAMHHMAGDLWTHMGRSVLFAYAVVVVSLPTILWIAHIGALGIAATRRHLLVPDPLNWVLVVAALSPAVFALAGIPGHHRYHNIALLLFALAAAVRFTRILPWPPIATAALLGLSIAAETLPFKPLHAAFRPVWATYAEATDPKPGHLNPSWVGWGEEVMLMGKHLLAQCQSGKLTETDCDNLRIAAVYRGRWLGMPQGAASGWINDFPERPIDSNTFIVVNRSAIVQGRERPPIEPDAILAFRGFEQAWAYRADRAAAAGWVP